MNYQTLTELVNSFNGNPQSKMGVLRLFHGYDNFADPRIELRQAFYQVTWDPLDGGGSIKLLFQNDQVEFIYVNRLGIVEQGIYKVDDLKRELLVKIPKLENHENAPD